MGLGTDKESADEERAREATRRRLGELQSELADLRTAMESAGEQEVQGIKRREKEILATIENWKRRWPWL